jgi:hypothetical protein
MSTPLGEETLAAVPVPLDRLTAHINASREGLERGQGHRAAHELLALPPDRLVQFGVDAMQPDQLIGCDDRVADDDLSGTGEAVGTPDEDACLSR